MSQNLSSAAVVIDALRVIFLVHNFEKKNESIDCERRAMVNPQAFEDGLLNIGYDLVLGTFQPRV